MLNNATQVHRCDLFTITTVGGTVLRYTSDDVATTANGITFTAGPVIKRGRVKNAVGVEVDSMDMSIAADASITVDGKPILQYIASGGFDNADVVVEKAFSNGPGQPWVGTVHVFGGIVSEVNSCSRYDVAFTVASDSQLLNVKVPRGIYQPGCPNTLFDSACGLVKASFKTVGKATGNSSASRTQFPHNMTLATGYCDLGSITFTSGLNNGITRTIKTHVNGGNITVIQPWPYAVANNDTFEAYPGCDKTKPTCSGKFSNILNFRGQPFIPAPETVT